MKVPDDECDRHNGDPAATKSLNVGYVAQKTPARAQNDAVCPDGKASTADPRTRGKEVESIDAPIEKDDGVGSAGLTMLGKPIPRNPDQGLPV